MKRNNCGFKRDREIKKGLYYTNFYAKKTFDYKKDVGGSTVTRTDRQAQTNLRAGESQRRNFAHVILNK